MNNQSEKFTFYVGKLNFLGALEHSARLARLPAAKHYIFDMQSLGELTPFGMLYFSAQLRLVKERFPNAIWDIINYKNHKYASLMGFFDASGFQTGCSDEANKDDLRFIKISKLKIRDLHIEAGQGSTIVQEVVEERSRQMASVLTRGEAGDGYSVLQFSLREIIRNVVEHSNADYIWYAAQYWPMRKYAELSILDEGLGIKATLSRNPHLKLDSHLDALRAALLPGISGVAYEGRKPNRNNEWANSGYGLFVLNELCTFNGELSISSGDVTLCNTKGTEKYMQSNFSGTAIRLGIDINSIGKFSDAMKGINLKGEEIAKSDSFAVKNSSTSSKLFIEH